MMKILSLILQVGEEILLILFFIVVAVQSASHVWFFAMPWIAAHQASLSLTISWSLPKFMSI